MGALTTSISRRTVELLQQFAHAAHPRAPGYDRLNSHKRSALDVLHRRDRPSPLMSSDRDAKPVHIIEEDAINCACLAVGQGDGPAHQLLLGSLQFANYVRCSLVAGARTAHERRVHPVGAILLDLLVQC